jgi:uncharacterized protein
MVELPFPWWAGWPGASAGHPERPRWLSTSTRCSASLPPHHGPVLSGWAPKYFPTRLRTDIRGRLREQILFGTDHPSLPFERLLREWGELNFSDEVMENVFHRNAERVLGL